MGGSSGGGSETTTTTSKTEPPAFVIPYSKDLLRRASEQSQTFDLTLPPGSEQFVGFSPEEQRAQELIRQRAGYYADAGTGAKPTFSGGGFTPFNPGVLTQGGGFIGGPLIPPTTVAGDVPTPDEFGLASLLGLAGTGGVPGGGLVAGSAQFRDTDNLGRFTGGQIGFDPVTNALVNRSQGDLVDRFNTQVAPSTASRFQQGGILGGTAQQELESQQRFSLARALGDTEAGIRGDAVNRAFAADQAIAGITGQDLARQLAAGQALASIGGDQRNRQLAGAGFFSGLGTTTDALQRQRIADLEGVGGTQRSLQQAMLDADIQNLIYGQQTPLRQLDILGSAINTASGGFSNATGTTTGPGPARPNPFIGALGGIGSVMGGLGALGVTI